MDKPTDEQIKEFWEWCGFIYSGEIRSMYQRYYGWSYPRANGGFIDNQSEPPSIDLNNLFKYAVPKLSGHQKASLPGYFKGNGTLFEFLYVEDPALALFWAIWKVIHGYIE